MMARRIGSPSAAWLGAETNRKFEMSAAARSRASFFMGGDYRVCLDCVRSERGVAGSGKFCRIHAPLLPDGPAEILAEETVGRRFFKLK
jgi:hypothetical protein